MFQRVVRGAGFAGCCALVFAPSLGFSLLLLASSSGPDRSAQASEEQRQPGSATTEAAKAEPTGAVEGLVTFHGEVPPVTGAG